MRAAIQISGEFRCLPWTLQSFQTNILNDLMARGYDDIYIFCHTWYRKTTGDGTFPHEQWGKDWHQTISVFSTEEGLQIYRPVAYKVERLEEIEFLKGRSRILAMYYSIWEANTLRRNFEQENNITFDLVVRYRTDLVMESRLLEDMPTESSFLVIPKSTLALTCDGPFDTTDDTHICDYIAYGTPDTMNIYCSVFETWIDIPETPIGESCLAMHLRFHGIKATRRFLPFYLVDGTGTKRGVVKPSDFVVVKKEL